MVLIYCEFKFKLPFFFYFQQSQQKDVDGQRVINHFYLLAYYSDHGNTAHLLFLRILQT